MNLQPPPPPQSVVTIGAIFWKIAMDNEHIKDWVQRNNPYEAKCWITSFNSKQWNGITWTEYHEASNSILTLRAIFPKIAINIKETAPRLAKNL